MLIKGSIHLGIEKFCEIGLKKKQREPIYFSISTKVGTKRPTTERLNFILIRNKKEKLQLVKTLILCKDVLLGFFDFEFDLFESQHVEPHTSAA